MNKKILVIGAGPAGLSCAYRLSKEKKKFSVDIIEASNQVGGLSKTVKFNDYYYDLGGHRFFSKISEVTQLWDEVLLNDFITRNRLSRIYYNYKFYNYPLQIKNAFFNLGLIGSFFIGLSYIKAKLLPYKQENTFEQWVTNRFGARLYGIFFKTYTEKIWGIPCNEIRSEWASQRIKNLSLVTAIINALPWIKKPTIKTLLHKFKYPKLGPGMMYDAMANLIKKNRNFHLYLNTNVVKLTYKDNKWFVGTQEKNGKLSTKKYDEVVSTMPITSLVLSMDYKMPAKVKKIAGRLRYRDFLIVCLVFDKPNKLDDTWIYIHDSCIKAGRLQVLSSWSPFMVRDKNNSSYGVEYFCTENDNIWSKSDDELIKLAVSEVKKVKLIPKNYNCIQGNVVRVKKAYPIYDKFYNDNMVHLVNFVKSVPNLQVAGRYGMFKYNNMDHSIYTGLLAAKNIILGSYKYNIWSVNQDEEYQEVQKVKKIKKKDVLEIFEVNPPIGRSMKKPLNR